MHLKQDPPPLPLCHEMLTPDSSTPGFLIYHMGGVPRFGGESAHFWRGTHPYLQSGGVPGFGGESDHFWGEHTPCS